MGAGEAGAARTIRLAEQLLGVRTPVTFLLFFFSTVLSISLIFQTHPEHPAILSAHGWGYAPLYWEGELWRLPINQFLHTRLWHYLCNIYWFLLLAPVLEEILGSRRFFVQMLLAACAIGLAGTLGGEDGGIGLSGLIFFLFGYLLRLAPDERRAARVCERATCILLWLSLLLIGPLFTLLGWVEVGNVVHLSGCLFGLLAGELHRRQWRLPGWQLALATVLLMCLPVWQPIWRADWHFWKGYHSVDLQQQILHYRKSLEIEPQDPKTLYNLGLAYFEAGDFAAAEQTWLKNVALAPQDPAVCQALVSLYASRGNAEGVERWNQRLTRLRKPS